MVHFSEKYNLFFGDRSSGIIPDLFRGVSSEIIFDNSPFDVYKNNFGIKSLVFLHQVHGTDGLQINEENKNMPILEHDGDFLSTNLQSTAIGILTADCLPIVFYDTQSHAIALAHAGWRGS